MIKNNSYSMFILFFLVTNQNYSLFSQTCRADLTYDKKDFLKSAESAAKDNKGNIKNSETCHSVSQTLVNKST